MYTVKEIYFTLQGEGAQTGRPAVFCRFVGCNLWSGREEDREAAVCSFCDTDFVGTDGPGGGKFKDGRALAVACARAWQGSDADRLVVLTGGEPMLQVDPELIDALHAEGFRIAIETNGTQQVPRAIDWICVSPKAGAEVVQTFGEELKIVYPQAGIAPEDFETFDFRHFFLQPMDGASRKANTEAAITFCLNNPRWKLSLQTHKLVGIP